MVRVSFFRAPDVGLTLAHTFDEQLMEHYDVKAGTVAVLQPASFHSVHEPARHLLTRVLLLGWLRS